MLWRLGAWMGRGEWTLTRMVPPGKLFFVFEVDGVVRVAEDQLFIPTLPGVGSQAQVRGRVGCSHSTVFVSLDSQAQRIVQGSPHTRAHTHTHTHTYS